MKKNELRKWRDNYTPFTGTCLSEGLKLNVHFDEKDSVKKLGARWNPDPSGKGGYWWMPANRLERDMVKCGYGGQPAIVNIFDPAANSESIKNQTTSLTILDWLNRNQMVSGEQHGDLLQTSCVVAAQDHTGDEYFLMLDDGTAFGFTSYKELNIVLLKTDGGENWTTTENARNVWDSLVKCGAKKCGAKRMSEVGS